MKKKSICLGWLWICVFFLAGHGVWASEKMVKAKIGIEIFTGQDIQRAKSRDTLKPGDKIRIYVHTRESANVYVVSTDKKKAILLNMTNPKIGEPTFVCLPSADAYYKVDGISPVERLIILCSQEKIPEISKMTDSGIPWSQWVDIEARLSNQSTVSLTQSLKPTIEIAGNTKGLDGAVAKDDFVDTLPTYSGKGLLTKIYEFKIQ